MAKWYGVIGYNLGTVETSPGVWGPQIVERNYYGEIIRNSRRTQDSNQVNDNINITNSISILADPFANQNSRAMCYVEFQGAKWKITNITIDFPRLILEVGGVYNGEQT